jgi:hypothetical protein
MEQGRPQKPSTEGAIAFEGWDFIRLRSVAPHHVFSGPLRKSLVFFFNVNVKPPLRLRFCTYFPFRM